MRYRVIFATTPSGGYAEFSDNTDAAAIAHARYMATVYGDIVDLTERGGGMVRPIDFVDIPDEREPEHHIPDAVCDMQTDAYDGSMICGTCGTIGTSDDLVEIGGECAHDWCDGIMSAYPPTATEERECPDCTGTCDTVGCTEPGCGTCETCGGAGMVYP